MEIGKKNSGIALQGKKALTAGMIGNVLEWYDFGVYVFLAKAISEIFFPKHDPTAAMISTLGIFAAGFLMRPLGAIVFGHYGDKYGRKNALVASIFFMAIPTFAMGLLPGYESIGIAAPIALTIMRLMQGLSLGGEYTGSVSFLVEHAPQNRRGYYGSWATAASIGGVLLGSAVGAGLSFGLEKQDLFDWGWRVAFLGGILIGIVGFYIRRGLEESGIFKQMQNEGTTSTHPLRSAVTEFRMSILAAIGLSVSLTSCFYIVFTYIQNYMSTIGGMTLQSALLGNTIGMSVLVALIPVMGLLSDRIGRKPLVLFAVSGLIVFSIPLFGLFLQGTLLSLTISLSIFAIFEAAMLGVVATLLVEIFPARVRFTAVSLGYNLAIAIFGGGAPALAAWLIGRTGNPYMPAYYLMICAGITFISALRVKETYKKIME